MKIIQVIGILLLTFLLYGSVLTVYFWVIFHDKSK